MEYKDVYTEIRKILVDYLRVERNEVKPDTNIIDDLCADSIALVELGFRFSETFDIPMIEGNSELVIVENLVDFIHKSIGEQQEV
ncbi:MAG: acyl carrier protein [Halanaerobiaceae bacterium]